MAWMCPWTGCGPAFQHVTATCKPMVSPVGFTLTGPPSTLDMLPLSPDGKRTTKPVLFKLMQDQGWETDRAALPYAKLWAETGRFRSRRACAGSAPRGTSINRNPGDTADCILDLVHSGRELRVVTDHGWLLMPGGLPLAALDGRLGGGKRQAHSLCTGQAERGGNLLPSDSLDVEP